jgi:hypothetical protein
MARLTQSCARLMISLREIFRLPSSLVNAGKVMLLREKSSFLEKLAHAVEAMATIMETRIKYLMMTNVEVVNEAVVEVEVEGFPFQK